MRGWTVKWAIIGKKNRLPHLAYTEADTRKEAIAIYRGHPYSRNGIKTWKQLYRMGYRAIRVAVRRTKDVWQSLS